MTGDWLVRKGESRYILWLPRSWSLDGGILTSDVFVVVAVEADGAADQGTVASRKHDGFAEAPEGLEDLF